MSVTDVARAVVRVLSIQATLLMRSGTLRIVNLDSAAVMRNTCLECLVKSRGSRGAM